MTLDNNPSIKRKRKNHYRRKYFRPEREGEREIPSAAPYIRKDSKGVGWSIHRSSRGKFRAAFTDSLRRRRRRRRRHGCTSAVLSRTRYGLRCSLAIDTATPAPLLRRSRADFFPFEHRACAPRGFPLFQPRVHGGYESPGVTTRGGLLLLLLLSLYLYSRYTIASTLEDYGGRSQQFPNALTFRAPGGWSSFSLGNTPTPGWIDLERRGSNDQRRVHIALHHICLIRDLSCCPLFAYFCRWKYSNVS